jgi:hypothetical protein
MAPDNMKFTIIPLMTTGETSVTPVGTVIVALTIVAPGGQKFDQSNAYVNASKGSLGGILLVLGNAITAPVVT